MAVDRKQSFEDWPASEEYDPIAGIRPPEDEHGQYDAFIFGRDLVACGLRERAEVRQRS